MKLIDVDNSRLVPVAECTTKAALKALHYGGIGDSRDAMDVGNVCHDGLEAHYSGKTRIECIQVFDNSYITYFPPDERTVEADRLSYGNVKDHFTVYIDRHPVETQPFEVLEAETILGMPLDDAGEIYFWIKRDLKVKDKATGFILPLDHKTTGQVNHYWQMGWRLASQLAGYTWATHKETGEICPGAYVNAIELNLLPTSSKRCSVHKIPFTQCRLEHTKSSLLYYDYIIPIRDTWRQSAIMLARRLLKIKESYPTLDMVQYAPSEGMFNRACGFCEFSKFCRAGKLPHLAETFLSFDEFAPWKDDDAKFIDWRE